MSPERTSGQGAGARQYDCLESYERLESIVPELRATKMFADVLRASLIGSKLSQSQFAQRVPVDKSTVSRWLSGERLPDACDVVAIARALELKVADEVMLLHALISDGQTTAIAAYAEALLISANQSPSDAVLHERVHQVENLLARPLVEEAN